MVYSVYSVYSVHSEYSVYSAYSVYRVYIIGEVVIIIGYDLSTVLFKPLPTLYTIYYALLHYTLYTIHYTL